MSMEGVLLDGVPRHPQIRRGTPRAFARPSTTIAAPEVKRTWRHVPARGLDVGDNVPGIGTLDLAVTAQDSTMVRGGDDNYHRYHADEPVFAFTAA